VLIVAGDLRFVLGLELIFSFKFSRLILIGGWLDILRFLVALKLTLSVRWLRLLNHILSSLVVIHISMSNPIVYRCHHSSLLEVRIVVLIRSRSRRRWVLVAFIHFNIIFNSFSYLIVILINHILTILACLLETLRLIEIVSLVLLLLRVVLVLLELALMCRRPILTFVRLKIVLLSRFWIIIVRLALLCLGLAHPIGTIVFPLFRLVLYSLYPIIFRIKFVFDSLLVVHTLNVETILLIFKVLVVLIWSLILWLVSLLAGTHADQLRIVN